MEDEVSDLRDFNILDAHYELDQSLFTDIDTISNAHKVRISEEVEKIKLLTKSETYLHSLSLFVDYYRFDISTVTKLLSPTLLDKIRHESNVLGLLKKSKRDRPTLNVGLSEFF